MLNNIQKVIISDLDYQIIEKVKSLRIADNISKQELSKKMGVAVGFIGKVETLSLREKYNIRHLTLIAKALKLKSAQEILPKAVPKNDLIEITYEKVPKINKDGRISRQLEERVVKIEPVKD